MLKKKILLGSIITSEEEERKILSSPDFDFAEGKSVVVSARGSVGLCQLVKLIAVVRTDKNHTIVLVRPARPAFL